MWLSSTCPSPVGTAQSWKRRTDPVPEQKPTAAHHSVLQTESEPAACEGQQGPLGASEPHVPASVSQVVRGGVCAPQGGCLSLRVDAQLRPEFPLSTEASAAEKYGRMFVQKPLGAFVLPTGAGASCGHRPTVGVWFCVGVTGVRQPVSHRGPRSPVLGAVPSSCGVFRASAGPQP